MSAPEKTPRRRRGTGTIERSAGRRRLRLTTSAGRISLGVVDSEAEANALLEHARAELATATHERGLTLCGWRKWWLDRREEEGFRNIADNRRCWAHHVDKDPLADLPIGAVARADVMAWVDRVARKRAADRRGIRRLARQTVQNALNLLRSALADACDRGVIGANPAADVRVPRRETRAAEPWTYLTAEEQTALWVCPAVPVVHRLWMQFAVGSGLRAGEQFNLHLADLRLDGPEPEIIVRWGSKHHGPKSTRGKLKIRRVPLFGLALEAAQAWIALLPVYCPDNPHGLVFPGPTGARKWPGKQLFRTARVDGKARPVDLLPTYLAAAEIQRDPGKAPVVWHSFRHTCAAALVSGKWGRRWSLEEIKGLLGHESITTTERYAHLAHSALRVAAAETSAAFALSRVARTAPWFCSSPWCSSRGSRASPWPFPGRKGLALMPRKATGSVEQKHGRWYARLTLGPGERPWFALPTCATKEAAEARKDILAELAVKLRNAGVAGDVAEQLLERAGARDGKALAAVLDAADVVSKGQVRRERQVIAASLETFESVGKRWTSGELAEEHPDHVKTKKSVERDRQRLERYVYPIVGRVPIAEFTLDHAEDVMRALPRDRVRTPATRRHVAQILHRVLSLAIFPLKLIKANPLPRGFMPKIGPGKAKGWLYPDEDAAVLSSPAVPLCWRVFYGFLNREGPRVSEAAALTVADVDLRRGVLTLDENKTDDPRAWALSPGVAGALRAWLEHRQATGKRLAATAPLFVDESGERIRDDRNAGRFREHLRAAGVTRPALFERSAARQHIRLHDTRATFVTTALANGRSETWAADRTGHRSSQMINRYRRAARTAAELGLGELRVMSEVIPEFRGKGAAQPPAESSPGIVPGAEPDAPNTSSGAWIRTMIRGFKVPRPALRRRRIVGTRTIARVRAQRIHRVAPGLQEHAQGARKVHGRRAHICRHR